MAEPNATDHNVPASSTINRSTINRWQAFSTALAFEFVTFVLSNRHRRLHAIFNTIGRLMQRQFTPQPESN